MQGYLVLGVSAYDFVNDNGERVQGCKVTYCDEPEQSDRVRGMIPMTTSADMSMFSQFSVLPGFYDLFFRQKASKAGAAPKLVLVGTSLLQPVELEKAPAVSSGK